MKDFLKAIRHLELVERSVLELGEKATELILRQAQDDKMRERDFPRSQTPFGNALVSATPLLPFQLDQRGSPMELAQQSRSQIEFGTEKQTDVKSQITGDLLRGLRARTTQARLT